MTLPTQNWISAQKNFAAKKRHRRRADQNSAAAAAARRCPQIGGGGACKMSAAAARRDRRRALAWKRRMTSLGEAYRQQLFGVRKHTICECMRRLSRKGLGYGTTARGDSRDGLRNRSGCIQGHF
jgi:hypothetical protein